MLSLGHVGGWHLFVGVVWLVLVPVTVPLVLGNVEFVPRGA